MRIRAMYFSGTGTTAKVCTAVAYRMWRIMDDTEHKINVSRETDDPIDYVKEANIDFTVPDMRRRRYVFDSRDIVVFGVPVFAGRVPNVLLSFLDTIEGGGAAAVPVVLYGNRDYDDGLIELRNILRDRGFSPVAAGAFIGEHSFSRKLAAGRPDREDMKKAGELADMAAGRMLDIIGSSDGSYRGVAEAVRNAGTVKVKGQEPLRPYYRPVTLDGRHINILKVRPVVDPDRCTGCGICAARCPMGSIIKGRPASVEGICIKCGGCVKSCPGEAISFTDEGYIYHRDDLEKRYGERKEPELFI